MLVPPLIVVVVLSLALGFYLRAQEILQEELKRNLRNTVIAASTQFDGEQVKQVTGPEDKSTQAYQTLVVQLADLQASIPDILFAYIMRQTDDPLMVAFVADGDGALTVAELDDNGDGMLQDHERAAEPGEMYEVKPNSVLTGEAFEQPTVDRELTEDIWGTFISAYAPIRDNNGQTVAILGIDMDAERFHDLSIRAFSPLAFGAVAATTLFIAIYVAYVMHLRRAQAQYELEQHRGALLDLATHQLGAPLATFRWWLEILRERQSKKCDVSDICDQFEQGVHRMDNIMQAMRYANQLTRSINYRPKKVLLATVLKKAVAHSLPFAQAKKQEIDLAFQDAHIALLIDDKLIGGVFDEILQNAIDYSPQRSTINVVVKRKRSDIRIAIQDQGCGVPKKELEKVFERFTRGSNASKVKPVGNGLGLAISRKIIERAGGRIWLESTIGKGTTVHISLPLSS